MCKHGTVTVVETPNWLWEDRSIPENGISIDACIAGRVIDAWTKGVRTLGSCCGHGKKNPSVVLVQDLDQPQLARETLPGFTLYQWQLLDVTKAVG